MGKAHPDPEKTVKFHCRACGHKFVDEPEAVIADDSRPWHPWRYESECPKCGDQAGQIWWQQNLYKAYANATGPRTEEGIRRCKFNSLTHGLTAKVATYYPARPGSYAQCTGCRYLAGLDCLDFGGCLTRTEILLRHLMAFEAGDPRLLQGLNAERQAHLAALADDMILSILQDGGPRTKTPDWYHDKDGGFHLARYRDENTDELVQLYRLDAHPMLKPLMDLIAKNGMTLTDQGMTPKVQDDQSILEGHLDEEAGDRDSMVDYGRRQAEALENLAGMIERSRERIQSDPILVEHQAIEGEAKVINPESQADA